MKKIAAAKLETIANKLRLMPPAMKQPDYSPQEAVTLLKPEIAGMQQRGYSLGQISKTLRGEGLEIDAQTLKSYLLGPAEDGGASTKATKRPSLPVKAATKLKGGTSLKAAAPLRASPAKLPAKKATKKLGLVRPTRTSKSGNLSRAMFDLKPDTDDI